MGQCKSKPGVLGEGGNLEPRSRKPNKRKWRKSKGSSLPASLEADLHCSDEDRLVTRGTPKNGLVLVSYSVTDLENKQACRERRNSYHPPATASPLDELVSKERGAPEWEAEAGRGDKKSPPIAEPEGDLSCYSTPAKTVAELVAKPSPPASPPSSTITVHADVLAPESCLEDETLHYDSLSLDSFASAYKSDKSEEGETSRQEESWEDPPPPGHDSELPPPRYDVEATQILTRPPKEKEKEREKPSVTFAEPEDAGALGQICGPCSGQEAAVSAPGPTYRYSVGPVKEPALEPGKEPSAGPENSLSGHEKTTSVDHERDISAHHDKETSIAPENDASVGHEKDSYVPVKKSSVVVSHPASRLSLPVPTNVSAILQSGLATVSFLEPATEEAAEGEGQDREELDQDLADLHIIVQPPLIFSGRPSPADFPQLDKLAGIVRADSDQNDNVATSVPQEAASWPSDQGEADAAICQTEPPLVVESGTGWQEHEEGSLHEIVHDARRKSSLEATLSTEAIRRNDKVECPAVEVLNPCDNRDSIEHEDNTGQDGCANSRVEEDQGEMDDISGGSRYTTVNQLRRMFLKPAVPSVDGPHRAGGVGGCASMASASPQDEVRPEGTLASSCRPSAVMELQASMEGAKYSDSQPKVEGTLSPAVMGGEHQGESPKSSSLQELLERPIMEDSSCQQFCEESQLSETSDEFNNDYGGSLGNEPSTEDIRGRRRNASKEEEGEARANIRDNYQAAVDEPGGVPGDAEPTRVAGGLEGRTLAGGEDGQQEPADASCNVLEGHMVWMREEVCPGSDASKEEHPGLEGEEGSSNITVMGEQSIVPYFHLGAPGYQQPQADDKNSIPSSCGDGIGGVRNSDLEQIRKLREDGETGGSIHREPSKRSRVVSFSLDLVSHENTDIQVASVLSPGELSDSLTEETPKAGETSQEQEAEEDAATLSDISPISDFVALPELPVEEEWACLAQEAALATAPGGGPWGAAFQNTNGVHYGNEDEDRTIMDDHTDVSFSLPSDPSPPSQEELADSCLDLTSPTPSQSTSTDSRGSWQQFALAQSGYSARLPPQGCSGSSEEDEGAGLGLDSGEDCYDSLEDLKRGAGLRRLPAVPSAPPARRELVRSQTFSSTTPDWGRSSGGRRKLPQIPTRALSVAGREEPGGSGEQRSRRAVSVGRELPSRRSRLEASHYDDKIRSPETSMDSGCHSFEAYGEETSVDAPEQGLLPRRNPSNFLWVDFQPPQEKPPVVRRPKNHDRLVQARKAQNRHSAPPGSLESSAPVPPVKRSSVGSRGAEESEEQRSKRSVGSRRVVGPVGWLPRRPQSAQGPGIMVPGHLPH